MPELSPIGIHLTLKNHIDKEGKTRQSCLTAALTQARSLTGRNLDTGIPNSIDSPELGNWAGAMCYTIILDQIGTCYIPKSIVDVLKNTPSIKKALHYFTELPEMDINAIYALRCAFFHDFGLVNINANKPELQHLFSVYNHPSSSVVIHPKEKWDGDLYKDKTGKSTSINLKMLGDWVEVVYTKLLLLHKFNELNIVLAGGEVELLTRYTFMH